MNYIWQYILAFLVIVMIICSGVIYYKYKTLEDQFNEKVTSTSTVENFTDKVIYSKSFIGNSFQKGTILEYSGKKEINISSNNYKLILLFSYVDCQPCLKDALMIISEYYNLNESLAKDKIFAIVKSENVNETLKWKKAAHIQFPIGFDKNNALFSKIHLIKLPILFLLDQKDNIILSLYIDQDTLVLLPSFLDIFSRYIKK